MTTLKEIAESLHTTTEVLKELGKTELPLLPLVSDDADLPYGVEGVIVAAWEAGPVNGLASADTEPHQQFA